MTNEDLRQIVDIMERRAKSGAADVTRWSRAELISYIESLRPIPKPKRVRPPRVRKPRMPRNTGVGRYCEEVLAIVVERDSEGHDWGLSYEKMTKMVQKEFPDSAADERHLRWYAAKMRRDGKTIPVYRERSRWI